MTEAPKIGIELWPIDNVKPYPENAKKHPEDQVKKLAKLISKYGWTQPIVVDLDGVIIAGHGRRLAAISLGLKRVPVVCRKDLTKEEANAMRLADNRVVSTEYDFSLQMQELMKLQKSGIDVLDLGFDERELNFSANDLGEIDLSAFTEDIMEEVEKQKRENADAAKRVDETAAPLADALGFKRVTIHQSRTLRNFMNRVEHEMGETGAAALVAWVKKHEFAM